MKDKVALITGASRGIGKAIALELAQSGVKLALTARTADALEEVAAAIRKKGGQSVVLPYDLSDYAGVPVLVEQARKALGPVNMLINNAGIYKTDEVFRTGMMPQRTETGRGEALESGTRSAGDDKYHDIEQTSSQKEQAARATVAFKTEDPAITWRKTIDVNLTAPFELIRAVVPSMIEKRWGRIINVSSISGLKAEVYGTSYSASKFGLIGLTQALALELARHNITVNAVCPGWVNTQMAVEQINDPGWCKLHEIPQSESWDIARLSVPQGRFIEPEEVAHLVAFLLSDNARGITGQSINICGGLSLT